MGFDQNELPGFDYRVPADDDDAEAEDAGHEVTETFFIDFERVEHEIRLLRGDGTRNDQNVLEDVLHVEDRGQDGEQEEETPSCFAHGREKMALLPSSSWLLMWQKGDESSLFVSRKKFLFIVIQFFMRQRIQA